MNLCVVRKEFFAGDVQLEVGEVVETSDWKNTKGLLSQRFLEPFQGEDHECPFCDPERFFASEEVLAEHIVTQHPEEVPIEQSA